MRDTGGMAADVVPGMADAIERRWVERYDSFQAFARAAGASVSGLYPARRGERRRYSAKMRAGIARALEWPIDWLDLIERGEEPPTVRYDNEGRALAEPPRSVEDEIDMLRRQVDALQARLDELDRGIA